MGDMNAAQAGSEEYPAGKSPPLRRSTRQPSPRVAEWQGKREPCERERMRFRSERERASEPSNRGQREVVHDFERGQDYEPAPLFSLPGPPPVPPGEPLADPNCFILVSPASQPGEEIDFPATGRIARLGGIRSSVHLRYIGNSKRPPISIMALVAGYLRWLGFNRRWC